MELLLYQPKFVIDLLRQREKYHLRLKLLYNLLFKLECEFAYGRLTNTIYTYYH
jgi:hypothetical protein